MSILDKPYAHYSKEYKERAIKRVLLGNEAINAVALDLGLPSRGMLSNWIRSYKENGYNVVIKKKGKRTHEQERVERIRTAQAKQENAKLRRQNLKLTVENAYIKKLDALVQKRKSQPKQK